MPKECKSRRSTRRRFLKTRVPLYNRKIFLRSDLKSTAPFLWSAKEPSRVTPSTTILMQWEQYTSVKDNQRQDLQKGLWPSSRKQNLQ